MCDPCGANRLDMYVRREEQHLRIVFQAGLKAQICVLDEIICAKLHTFQNVLVAAAAAANQFEGRGRRQTGLGREDLVCRAA